MDYNFIRLVFQRGAAEKTHKQGTYFVTNDSPKKFLIKLSKSILGQFPDDY